MQLGGICAEPGCHVDTPAGVRRCPTHTPAPFNGGARAKRLPGNWKTLRQQVLARDGYRCVKCGAGGPAVNLEVDHITPGDNHDPTNLQSLCVSCHRRKTNTHDRVVRRGWGAR